MRIGPCMCGATDCWSCGPAQGYSLGDDSSEVEWRCACGHLNYTPPEDPGPLCAKCGLSHESSEERA